MFEDYTLRRDSRGLEMARGAWMAMADMRKRRQRYKDFTYGRQWGDLCRAGDGRLLSEEQRMSEEGRVPITNNIIRQTVKSIIGRYRHMCRATDQPADRGILPSAGGFGPGALEVSETDARALEEFLISGCVVQTLHGGKAENVSPNRFFAQSFTRTDASDCRLMGLLQDLSLPQVLERFGEGDPRKARALKRALQRGTAVVDPFPGQSGTVSFSTPGKPGTYRVIEMWRLQGTEYLEVTDPVSGQVSVDTVSDLERLEGLNRARAEVDSAPLTWRHRVEEHWEGVWLTPCGEVLGTESLGRGEFPPLALRFYPLIDGEVHSLVEDIIDQQKTVNRLISLLDHIISSSAKGVLLYPADQLPEGFTWKDIRRIWSNPMGILPFKRTAKGVTPQQVNAAGNGAGATEMLRLQLQLFEQISGATGAMRGRSSSATGEGMLRTELENAMVSMLDLLASFRAFVLERDARLTR